MPAASALDPLTERVERLLVRHQEVLRTNTLLVDQIERVRAERDALKARLATARSRIETLLERLPADSDKGVL